MAQVLKITDGTDTVDFLSSGLRLRAANAWDTETILNEFGMGNVRIGCYQHQ